MLDLKKFKKKSSSRAISCRCSTGSTASSWLAASLKWSWPTQTWCRPWACLCCVACVCSGCSRWPSTGSHCPTWSPRCSTRFSPSCPCWCCSSCSSWSLPCWACKCSAASSTSTPPSTSLAATSTPSRRVCSRCFRYGFETRDGPSHCSGLISDIDWWGLECCHVRRHPILRRCFLNRNFSLHLLYHPFHLW